MSGGEAQGERRLRITEAHLHPHLRMRMHQRGITLEEIERVMNEGWEAPDAKPGTWGRVLVFPYGREWEGQYFEEKEVRVYYKLTPEGIVLLTAIARYGKGFLRREE
ncbi:MAG: DUF4258 domain-containing protein [Thermoflexus sp.]|nr:DUF4258 domain-containing protein [Thermoflexus sp.]